MQLNKKSKRLKRAKKTRVRLKNSNAVRLVVNKSNKNLYAQVISKGDTNGDIVLASASTLDKELLKSLDKKAVNSDVAKKIGSLVAKRAIANKVTKVSFDRSGYKYHGVIQALADSAREHGLEF